MKQADIKRLERAYAQLSKAYDNIKLVELHLWKDGRQNEWIGNSTEYSIVKEAARGVCQEWLNLQYKLSAIKEVNKE